MTDAPERIWVDTTTECDVWTWDKSDTFPKDVEYIRADTVAAMVAEARNAALEEAAQVLDRHDSAPCSPVHPESCLVDQIAFYVNGQIDAASSWQNAIRALKDAPQ